MPLHHLEKALEANNQSEWADNATTQSKSTATPPSD